MELGTIEMDKDEARARSVEYLRLPESEMTEEDRAILAGYLALEEGVPVININDTVRAGGLDENGRPRLALGRADWSWCHLRLNQWASGGQVTFMPEQNPHHRAETFSLRWEGVDRPEYGTRRSQVPAIPPEHRPKKWRLRDYLILWEVEEWAQAPVPPGDPALLRPLGHGLAAVDAMWDLTDLERTVLGARR